MTAADGRPRRLFFALWPDDATRDRLRHSIRSIARHSGGQPVPTRNLHVTLAFLGNVPAERFDAVVQAANGARLEPLTLALDRFGYFPAPRVLWIGPAETPESLRGLVRDLWSALARVGLSPDFKPFHAHMTIARKVQTPPELSSPSPVHWLIEGFALVESETDPHGSRYQVVATFGHKST